MTEQVEVIQKKQRSSNLELFRIICMLMIVAHHYVVNSGLMTDGGPIDKNPGTISSLFLQIFGAWGKTGINCFLMITGYYMCKSHITIRKFVKLFLQILFYNIVIYILFYFIGYESLSLEHLIHVLIPFWGFSDGFTSCFIAFYLTIPFWNILISNMSEQQHLRLMALMLICYSVLGSIPTFTITFNYITWFGIIYLIASFFRFYPKPLFEKRTFWGWLTMISLFISSSSIVLLAKLNHSSFLLVSDCNKIMAVIVAVCSFLWFKNIKLQYSKIINNFGAATFGVLLIHTNSQAMRTWLWKDTIDVVGHFDLSFFNLVLFSSGCVFIVFMICNLIDQLRIATIEKWFFRWYDHRFLK